MFCTNCGAKIPENARFCKMCGVAIDSAASDTANVAAQGGPRFAQDPSLPEGIFRDEVGRYHWLYHMNMWKGPVPLFTLIKLSLCFCAGMGLLNGIAAVVKYGDFQEALKFFVIITFGIGGFLVILSLIAWAILSAVRGGHYVVEHMMTEDKVVYLETQEEKERTGKLAATLFILSMLNDDTTAAAAGAGALAGERFDSSYQDVRAVIADRRHNLIKVNNILQRNTIYAYPHQYDFVWNYITSRCPNAKIRG